MIKIDLHKNVFITGALLALCALIGTGMMVVVNGHSKPYIAENERQVLLRSLHSVIPSSIYTNNILNDTLEMKDHALLGSQNSSIIYRAKVGTTPIAAALTVIAPNGYSGDISLLVGINFSGQVTGVRVVKHRETPGLGDSIEIRRSNWIEIFIGKSITNPNVKGWKVKRDGGEFDQFTGATITPRAVVGAVHKAVQFFNKNKNIIFPSYNITDSKKLLLKPRGKDNE